MQAVLNEWGSRVYRYNERGGLEMQVYIPLDEIKARKADEPDWTPELHQYRPVEWARCELNVECVVDGLTYKHVDDDGIELDTGYEIAYFTPNLDDLKRILQAKREADQEAKQRVEYEDLGDGKARLRVNVEPKDLASMVQKAQIFDALVQAGMKFEQRGDTLHVDVVQVEKAPVNPIIISQALTGSGETPSFLVTPNA